MTNPIEVANDIKAAIIELADGRSFPDLLEAVDSLAALSRPMDAVAPASATEQARRFHEAYERLAPSFGYETRPETRTFDPESPNGRLMIAVCAALSAPKGAPVEATEHLLNDLRTHFVELRAAVGHPYNLAIANLGINSIDAALAAPKEQP